MNPDSEQICFVKGCNKVLTGECCRLPSNPNRGMEILEFIGRDELILTPYEDLREICLMCKDHFEVVPDEPTVAESENSYIMSETMNSESSVSESVNISENITSSNSDEGLSVNLTTCNIQTKCWTDGCDKFLMGQECYGLPNDPKQAARVFKFIEREDLMFFPFEQVRSMVFMCKEHFEMAPDESKENEDVSQNAMSQYANNFNNVMQMNYQTIPNGNMKPNSSHNIIPIRGLQNIQNPMKQVSQIIPSAGNKIIYQVMPNSRQMSPAVSSGSNKITCQVMPNTQSASSSSSSSDSSAAGSTTHHSDDNHSDDNSSQKGSMMICKLCDRKFNGIEHLRSHMKARHSTMFCDRCDKAFVSPNYLRTHQRRHCKRIY